jgi:hypothetical protein
MAPTLEMDMLPTVATPPLLLLFWLLDEDDDEEEERNGSEVRMTLPAMPWCWWPLPPAAEEETTPGGEEEEEAGPTSPCGGRGPKFAEKKILIT